MTERLSRGPGQRAGLAHEDVVGAALAVLRRDGLDALSMRRVATELGVAPNALYSHVADKSALVDAVLDAVLAGVEAPRRGDWRARLERLLGDTRRVLLAHPDLITLYLARQMTGPNAFRLGEAMLDQLRRGGVADDRAVTALQSLLIHTIGGAAFEAARRSDPDPAGRSARGRRAAAALDPGAFPRTTALAEPMGEHHGDDVFRAGLRWLLDGLEAE